MSSCVPSSADIPSAFQDAFIKVSFEEVRDEPVGSGSDPAYEPWMENSSATRVATEIWSVDLLRKLYPGKSVVASMDFSLNLLAFPMAYARPLVPDQMIINTVFVPLARRSATVPGIIAKQVQFGAFNFAWDSYDFTVYIAQYPVQFRGPVIAHYIIHDGPEAPAHALLLAAGIWSQQLHQQILVFNQGFWRKSTELWFEVQKADWKDVILKQEFKDALQKDVDGFFKSEQIYRDLAIPWKRGLIMFGPPGNGKTISIKVIMKVCDDRGFAPLYVKSFQSYKGEEGAMEDVFNMGRQMSPCVVIFEDLDALINDRNRSFFLNQLDGLENNDGLLCIGSTNHFERLDPALSTRPSRFDRKYLFDDPDQDERALYARYWQSKLKSNQAISFPDSLVDTIAEMTDKFSFAYLKEAFVSTLVLLATQDDKNRDDFETILKRTIKTLRKQLDKTTGNVTSLSALGELQQMSPLPPQPERRDVRSMALAAVALGRSFIY